MAITMQPLNLDPFVENMHLSGTQQSGQTLRMRFPITLRDDDVGQQLPHHLIMRPTKNSVSLPGPVGNVAFGVHPNDRIERILHDRLEIGFAGRQTRQMR